MEATGTPPTDGHIDELITFLDGFVYPRMEMIELDQPDRELIVDALEFYKENNKLDG